MFKAILIAASITQVQYFPGNPDFNPPGLGCNAYCEQDRIDREQAQQDNQMRMEREQQERDYQRREEDLRRQDQDDLYRNRR